MNSPRLKAALYSILISLISFNNRLLFMQEASAQITPDSTLGAESSVVNQLNQLKSLIEGGAVRGENLFHSFQEFNVGNGQSVYFVNPDGVNNILTRVTGSNISEILGTLGVNGNANLFLINPNGFMFGDGAKLDLNGSFTSTTGDIQLGEDGVFSATDIEGSSLLSVKPAALFGNFQGQIENRANLVVRDGQNIILMADKVVNTGNLTAPAGMIKLEGNEVIVSGNSVIDVSGERGGAIQIEGWQVSMEDGSQILSNTLGARSGKDLTIKASKLIIKDGAFISATTLGEGEGGNINVQASESVELVGTGFDDFQQTFILPAFLNGTINPLTRLTGLFTGTTGSGNSGDINIDTPSLLLKDGAVLNSPTFGDGNGGSITLPNSETIELIGSLIATAASRESPKTAGNIIIDTDNLIARDGSIITTITFGKGDGGDIVINALDSVQLLTTQDGVSTPKATGIFSTSISRENIDNLGKAGNITINTGELIVRDGATVSTSSGGIIGGNVLIRIGGKAGDISINASKSVELTGISGLLSESFASGNRLPSSLASQTTTNNPGGNITIETGKLIIADGGMVSAATIGSGNAGNITIKASEVEVTGSSFLQEGKFSSNVEVSSGIAIGIVKNTATGNAGNLNMNTDRLIIRDGAFISATTLGEGEGGNINVQASESVEIVGTGFEDLQQTFLLPSLIGTISPLARLTGLFTGTAGSGNSGEINIDSPLLVLENGAVLNSLTFGDGNGGNISIHNSETIELISSLMATAATEDSSGTTGNIFFETDNLIARDGTIITTITFGKGDAGDITINASDSVELLRSQDGISIQMGIFSNSLGRGNITNLGEAGNININTGELIVRDGAVVSAASGSIIGGNIVGERGGKGGNIRISALESVEVTGVSGVFSGPFAPGTRLPSVIGSQTSTNNPGGNITIETGKLSLQDGGSVLTGTLGAGKAGNITIKASEVEVTGSSFLQKGKFSSNVEVSSGIAIGIVKNTATGNAGNLNMNTDRLIIRDGGFVSATTLGEGEGGNINVQASESVEIVGTGFDDLQQTFLLPSLIGTISPLARLTGLFTGTAGSGNSGEINIDSPLLVLENGAVLNSSTFGDGNGGNISIHNSETIELISSLMATAATEDSSGTTGNISFETDNLIARDGTIITTVTFGKGDAGDITINASDSVELLRSQDGISIQMGIFSNSLGRENITSLGEAGNININTGELIVRDGAVVSAASGSIIGGNIVSEMGGKAGNIRISASESVEVTGVSGVFSGPFAPGTRLPSVIGSQTSTNNPGGNITIETGKLSLQDGGSVLTGTLGAGKAGNITIKASEVEVTGSSFLQEGKFSSNVEVASGIAIGIVDNTTTGNAGNLNLNTDRLIIRDGGFVSATTLGKGEGGNINVQASESVEIVGTGFDDLQQTESLLISDSDSGIFANTELNSTGDGGNITINSPEVNLENNASIAVSSFGEGKGGDISITANLINLDNSDITGQTLSNDGGNISLLIQEAFILNNNSQITATAGTAQAGGDGGNIVINSPSILSNPSNPFNNITANAFEGQGGNIEITTDAIFGGEFLIIDASSQLGLDGEVIINDPDVDPTKGLIVITANFVDVESLIAQNPCAIEGDRVAGGSSFILSGKGGLPAQSVDFLRNNIILIPWLEVPPETSPSIKQPEEEDNQSIQSSSSQEGEKRPLFTSTYCGNPYVKRRKQNE